MTHLGQAIRKAHDLELELAGELAAVAERHAADPDVFHLCGMFGGLARDQATRLGALADQYGSPATDGTRSTAGETACDAREAGLRLLSDLTHLYVLTQECWIGLTALRQAALAKRDQELVETVSACLDETAAQAKWLKTRVKTTAPQALTVD